MWGSYSSLSDASKTYVYLSPEDEAKVEAWKKRVNLLSRKAVAWFQGIYGGSWEQVAERHPDFVDNYNFEKHQDFDLVTGQCKNCEYDLAGMCLFLFRDSIKIPDFPKVQGELRYKDTHQPVPKDEIEEIPF